MCHSYDIYIPQNNIRIVTATSLFDGHDASINIFRRILQRTGAEVIHLGHNRSVKDIVSAALEEDVQGIAVSSYQGGHVEFFKYIMDELKKNRAEYIKIFCGGGGVIVPEEKKELELYGNIKVYTPEDGSKMGLQGIVNHMVEEMDYSRVNNYSFNLNDLNIKNKLLTANLITCLECNNINKAVELKKIKKKLKEKIDKKKIPIIGITGTGGAGKSSLTDELILRFLFDFENINIAIISADPSKKKTGGALLGDRIRMNSITDRVYMRSVATRTSSKEVPDGIEDFINVIKASGYDLIIVETAGIGQGDSNIVKIVDLSIYVMTSDFGASSQLEKIDMLDFADIVVINKYDKMGSEDAFRDVNKQLNRSSISNNSKTLVFGTIASRFNDDGVSALYQSILKKIKEKKNIFFTSKLPKIGVTTSSNKKIIIPTDRIRYLSEITDVIKSYHKKTRTQANGIRDWWHLIESLKLLLNDKKDEKSSIVKILDKESQKKWKHLDEETKNIMDRWKIIQKKYSDKKLIYKVREKEIHIPLYVETLSKTKFSKIALPKFKDPGEIYKWMRKENLPGFFPYTAGVFPMKRVGEDPTRMFAGEGDPARTNYRFKLLSLDSKAKRLSTAFDSVTLYGCDPNVRPDIYGKVGNSGVSVCTLDDVKTLYDGFELCSSNTSVSMTINGPAPIILAMFFNTIIDQEIEKFKINKKRSPSKEEILKLRDFSLQNVRGTIQADILKEDQGQNTCIFSTNFALKMMGDIQEYFIDKKINNFYSVSISGYHIAEAGANPITQLAFTLANGFTYLEYYLSRGMLVDDIAPNLSFFFSNGMDPEYTVIGRVARRIWAIALKEKYSSKKRSQMLKYHIQTSGRSLHSQDIQFNDIRTTLQALCAIYDNCNSLHTNAFDEAITTPTEESVRRALAIQLIINKEWGLSKNENSLQGSFIVEELTDLVEEAVLLEFNRIANRGGVLGAMERGYQRSKIQEESMNYEDFKHDGRLPIVGVNIFKKNHNRENEVKNNIDISLSRATIEEKESQLKHLNTFKKNNKNEYKYALDKLQKVVLNESNIFVELMSTVRYCTLGQITEALYEVGGQYRRNM